MDVDARDSGQGAGSGTSIKKERERENEVLDGGSSLSSSSIGPGQEYNLGAVVWMVED
jgi:hypothetical protein